MAREVEWLLGLTHDPLLRRAPDRALHPDRAGAPLGARLGVLRPARTGLILYLPALSTLISRRNLVKNVHIWVAVALGDRDSS